MWPAILERGESPGDRRILVSGNYQVLAIVSQTCVVLEAGSPRQTIVYAIGCFALVSHSCIWSPWVSSDTSVVIDLLQSSLCLAHYWETRLLWTYWQKQNLHNTGHWGFWLRPSGWSWTCEVRRWCFQYCLGEIWENARWNSGRKGRFAGVLRGLAISHPPHPHLGEISQKNFFLDAFPKPMTQCKNGCRILSHGIIKILRACRNFGKVNA